MTQNSCTQGERHFQLFALADKSDTIYINGVEAVEFGYGSYTDNPSGLELRLSTPDDEDYHFDDQQVTLKPDGTVSVTTKAFSAEDEEEQVNLRFSVERTLSPDDLTSSPSFAAAQEGDSFSGVKPIARPTGSCC